MAFWSSSSPWWSATGNWFKLFWFRGDAAFAKPEIYEYCEEQRITYFIRLPANENLYKLVATHLGRPVGRPPKSGIQVNVVDLQYQAKSWHKPRRVVAKIEWHRGELFPRIGFVVTSSRLSAGKVTKVYNGRGNVENRIKEGKKPPCVGTRPAARGLRQTKPGSRWGFWLTTSCI